MAPRESELLAEVRRAANELAERLARAQQQTGEWKDASQTTRLVHAALQTCLDRLANTACWGEANRLPSGELWKTAARWLETGELQHRARFKPLGYAGDFQMLAQICAHYRCGHPLGGALDDFFQSQAAPRAVRNRTDLIAGQIVEHFRAGGGGAYAIASVGSGPTIDIQRALQQLTESERQNVRVTLLDLDPAALQYAREKLTPLLPAENIDARRENLFRLPRNPRSAAGLAETHFLVCSGLFDYLAPADALAMLGLLWRSLAPRGRLLAFNFAHDNPSRAYMEWIGNWYLIYRSRDELRHLAKEAGIPPQAIHIDTEPLDVNLFVQADKR